MNSRCANALVAGGDEGADEARLNHHQVKEEDGEDLRERETGDEEELEEEERRRDCPVDVAGVPNRTGWAGDALADPVSAASARTNELDWDSGRTESLAMAKLRRGGRKAGQRGKGGGGGDLRHTMRWTQ